MHRVDLSLVEKELRRLPRNIFLKVYDWADHVEEEGLEVVRQTPGFHDEPLKGKLSGLRSIRLNRSYRLIYKIAYGNIIQVIVVGVNKHEY